MSNYTTAMVSKLNASAPITRTVADDLAREIGLPVRSVISKAVLLGLYQKAEVKASSRSTKAEMVKAIEKALQGESLEGLEGASMRSLSALLMSIQQDALGYRLGWDCLHGSRSLPNRYYPWEIVINIWLGSIDCTGT